MKTYGFLAFFAIGLVLNACDEAKEESTKEKSQKVDETGDATSSVEKNETFIFRGHLFYHFSGEDVTGEYLFIEQEQNRYFYYSDKNPNGIELIAGSRTDKGHEMQFPGDQSKYYFQYETSMDGMIIQCENPDGTIQEFNEPLHVNAYFAEDSTETLINAGPPMLYLYFNKDHKKGVMPSITGGAQEISQFELSIKGKPLFNTNESDVNQVVCTLPDGSKKTLNLWK